MTFTGSDVIVDAVEYLTEDANGNLDVAETRTVGLYAVTQDTVPPPTSAAAPKRTTA